MNTTKKQSAIHPQNREGVRLYQREIESRVNALIEMQEWIFNDLPDPENVSEVITKLRRWTLILPGPNQRDGVAELVNSIVVAVVNETRSYDAIYRVIEGLHS
jgi:hypothetical protein